MRRQKTLNDATHLSVSLSLESLTVEKKSMLAVLRRDLSHADFSSQVFEKESVIVCVEHMEVCLSQSRLPDTLPLLFSVMAQ